MDESEQIKIIRKEIFHRAKKCEDLEIMHWYMWLDDCFENDEFHDDDAENIRWRIGVLKDKKELVNYLLELLTELLTARGFIANGFWMKKSSHRGADKQCDSR